MIKILYDNERILNFRKREAKIEISLPGMFKNIIAPMQAWLMSQGKCVGCGKPLERKKGLPAGRQGTGVVQVTCQCGRIYMYDTGSGKFRRATLDEVK